MFFMIFCPMLRPRLMLHRRRRTSEKGATVYCCRRCRFLHRNRFLCSSQTAFRCQANLRTSPRVLQGARLTSPPPSQRTAESAREGPTRFPHIPPTFVPASVAASICIASCRRTSVSLQPQAGLGRSTTSWLGTGATTMVGGWKKVKNLTYIRSWARYHMVHMYLKRKVTPAPADT